MILINNKLIIISGFSIHQQLPIVMILFIEKTKMVKYTIEILLRILRNPIRHFYCLRFNLCINKASNFFKDDQFLNYT